MCAKDPSIGAKSSDTLPHRKRKKVKSRHMCLWRQHSRIKCHPASRGLPSVLPLYALADALALFILLPFFPVSHFQVKRRPRWLSIKPVLERLGFLRF
jgi:hypothetical protein